MKIDDIKAAWATDCQINMIDSPGNDVLSEVIVQPRLVAKWAEIELNEKIILAKMRKKHGALLVDLNIAYHKTGRTPETDSKGFFSDVIREGIKLGSLPKVTVTFWEEHDPVRLTSQANLEAQEAKIAYLARIMWELSNRRHHIQNWINLKKYRDGY